MLLFLNIQEIEAIDSGDSKLTEFTEATCEATTLEAPTLEEQADTSAVDQNVQG